MSDTTFSNGTVIEPDWLNDVNDAVYNLPSVTENSERVPRVAYRHIHKNFAYDYSTGTIVVYDGSTGDGLHRHFGQLVEGIDGCLHLIYGRSTTHGVTANMTTYYRRSNDGGDTWSAEVEVIPADTTADQRSLSMCVTPTGRIVIIYAKVLVPSASPTVFRLRYSDDNGDTWTQGSNITTINDTYVRAYGRIKLIPGDSDSTYRLCWTPYYRSATGPSTYKVPVWFSEASDDGLVWTEGTEIVNDTTGYNETEMVAINTLTWFAVSRGPNGLQVWKTIDGGTTWSSVGVIPGTSSDNQVAPTLDKFCINGKWYLLVGYCDRSSDDLRWRIAPVIEALSTTNAFGSSLIVATDMVNASGYQCPVTKPDGTVYVDGGTAYIEFKEYVGQVYTQVRFVRMDLFDLARAAPRSITVASDTITLMTQDFFDGIIQVDTEGGAGTDDLATINGGRDGQLVVFQGPQTTSARDVTFKNGTGNIDLLRGDFRLNTTTSRLVLQRTGARWSELYRTDDNTNTAITIASDAITVPSSRFPETYLIDTEGGAATDTLLTINGGREGQMIILMSASSSRDTTISEGGNIVLDAAGSFTLTNVADTITLVKRSTTWYEVARSDNA